MVEYQSKCHEIYREAPNQRYGRQTFRRVSSQARLDIEAGFWEICGLIFQAAVLELSTSLEFRLVQKGHHSNCVQTQFYY